VSTETSTLNFTVTPAVHRATPETRAKLLADPGFGRIFTEHMVRISWSREQGWHAICIVIRVTQKLFASRRSAPR